MVQKSGEKTTWDVSNAVNNGMNYQRKPSTVSSLSLWADDFFHAITPDDLTKSTDVRVHTFF